MMRKSIIFLTTVCMMVPVMSYGQLTSAVCFDLGSSSQAMSYDVDPTNESLTGLFKSIIEYPAASERVTAQRCMMVANAPRASVNGEALFVGSSAFGYEYYDEFDRDFGVLVKHFRGKLKSMPTNPTSNWSAVDEPSNETRAILRHGSGVQINAYRHAVVRAFPDCLRIAKAESRQP